MTTTEELLLRDFKHVSDILIEDGDIQTVVGLENLRIALLHRLITIPGTLIHRPQYGVGVGLFQNALNTLDNQRLLATRIVENFGRDNRILEVEAVQVIENEDPSLLQINVKVQIVGREDAQVLEFAPFAEGVQIA